MISPNHSWSQTLLLNQFTALPFCVCGVNSNRRSCFIFWLFSKSYMYYMPRSILTTTVQSKSRRLYLIVKTMRLTNSEAYKQTMREGKQHACSNSLSKSSMWGVNLKPCLPLNCFAFSPPWQWIEKWEGKEIFIRFSPDPTVHLEVCVWSLRNEIEYSFLSHFAIIFLNVWVRSILICFEKYGLSGSFSCWNTPRFFLPEQSVYSDFLHLKLSPGLGRTGFLFYCSQWNGIFSLKSSMNHCQSPSHLLGFSSFSLLITCNWSS